MQLFSPTATAPKGKTQRPLYVSTMIPAEFRVNKALEDAKVQEYGIIIKNWAAAKGWAVYENGFKYVDGELFAWFYAPRRVRKIRTRVQRCRKLFLTVAYRVTTPPKKR